MDFEAKKQKAWELYQVAKANLEFTAENYNDPTAIAIAAQAAQNAWTEFKKMETEVTNGLVLKNLRDLYHV